MRERILVFGADGQVGWELLRALSTSGEVVARTQADLELTDPRALRSTIRAIRPTVIANAAAYTAVDRAESEPEVARAVNAAAPAIMAEEAKSLGAWLLHYSTDYVYDGTKRGRYVEDDAPNPLSVYGRTKLEGDEAVRRSGARHVILRTSWVFAARGSNFVRTILRLGRERSELRVVSDQVGAPTSAELLADVAAVALHAAQQERLSAGVYHLTAAGETSWHGFAAHVVREALRMGATLALAPERILAIPSSDYPTAAARPKNSRLDCARLEAALGIELPAWTWHAGRTLHELLRP